MNKHHTIQIRMCAAEDFGDVFQLLGQLWPTLALDKIVVGKIFTTTLKNHHQKLIVAVSADKIVGFCSLTIKNNFWQAGKVGIVDELVVDFHCRNQGIGKQLMKRIELIAIENDCKTLELESSFRREEAHKFYNTIGFTPRAYWFTKQLTAG